MAGVGDGAANGMNSGWADNRWQGYSHQELYSMLNAGPGSRAAGGAADRWAALADALGEIQQDISSGVQSSGAAWVGSAGDAARGALGPLGDWADQASTAATVMRLSTELQGDLLGKARADMPAPIPVPRQPSPIGQLITAQLDYEVAELASHAAEQRAFQVMAAYEAGTLDNTNSLGQFEPPPALVVDTTPITGTTTGRRVHPGRTPGRTSGVHSEPRPPSRAVAEEPGAARPGESTTEPVVDPESATSTSEPEPMPSAQRTVPPATESAVADGVTAGAADPRATPPPPRGTAAEPGPRSGPEPTDSPATGPSAAEPAMRDTTAARPTASPAKSSQSTAPQSSVPRSAPAGADPGPAERATPVAPARRDDANRGSLPQAVVPAARRPGEVDDDDDTHRSRYLIEAEDIYGDRRSFAPPVIGESRPRR